MVRKIGFYFITCVAALTLVGCGKTPTVQLPLDRASELLYHDKYDEARAICDDLISKDAKDIDALVLRGKISEEQSNLNAALSDYELAGEKSPNSAKPHKLSYLLLMKMAKVAKAEGDREETDRLETSALKHYNEFRRLDIDAATFANGGKRPSQQEFLAEQEEIAVKKEDIQNDESAFAKAMRELEDQKDEFPEFADSDNELSEKPDGDDIAIINQEENKSAEEADEPAKNSLTRQMDESSATEKEEALTMPPHSESEDEEVAPDLTPPPPITRFALPTDDRGGLLLPAPRRTTTGLVTLPTDSDSPEGIQTGPSLNRIERPGSGRVGGAPASGVRTGIGASRSKVASAGVPASGRGQYQPGLIPEQDRGWFGPRIVPLRKQMEVGTSEPATSNLPGDEATRRPPNAPILTTAIPGTMTLYNGSTSPAGTGPAYLLPSSRPGASRPGAPMANPFGSISDRNYTPFGVRPDAAKRTTPSMRAYRAN